MSTCWLYPWEFYPFPPLILFSCSHSISSVQSLSLVRLFATPWIATRQASLSITNSRSLFKLMSVKSVMPSSHLILCRPLLLLPPVPPSIRVFSNESTLRMRWPKYWSFSFSISPSNEHPGLISFRMAHSIDQSKSASLLTKQTTKCKWRCSIHFWRHPTVSTRDCLGISMPRHPSHFRESVK